MWVYVCVWKRKTVFVDCIYSYQKCWYYVSACMNLNVRVCGQKLHTMPWRMEGRKAIYMSYCINYTQRSKLPMPVETHNTSLLLLNIFFFFFPFYFVPFWWLIFKVRQAFFFCVLRRVSGVSCVAWPCRLVWAPKSEAKRAAYRIQHAKTNITKVAREGSAKRAVIRKDKYQW